MEGRKRFRYIAYVWTRFSSIEDNFYIVFSGLDVNVMGLKNMFEVNIWLRTVYFKIKVYLSLLVRHKQIIIYH